MPLQSPNLDDRDFHQLVEEARRQIAQSAPQWTDLSPGDPGIVLLELFAHLTETMIYRLNRIPEKAYIEFLRLIGVGLQPPASAGVQLQFSRARADETAITIARGTRVTTSRAIDGEQPVFVTAGPITIPAGATSAEAQAYHCEQIEAELIGRGTGVPGQTFRARHVPIIAPTLDGLDLIVGIETPAGRLPERTPVITYNGKAYRLWREVPNFTNLGSDRFVYVADRLNGTITFASAGRMLADDGTLEATPRVPAAIPNAGAEIRVWYRYGGGPTGNVAAGVLTTLKDPIQGVQVVNPHPATGGRETESLQNALVRGPQALHSLQRAVTARDFQLVAETSSRAVARAKAITRATLWIHALPGSVEVLLVPQVGESEQAGRVSAAQLQTHETEHVRAQIQQELDRRRPLGTTCVASWARYKTVQVQVRIVVRREEDHAAVRRRVLTRMYQTITPLPTPFNVTGWQFGHALRASHIYDIALAEPSVRWADNVRLLVEAVPDQAIKSIVADAFQPRTWYAGSASQLFRSLNDSGGWELVGSFPDEQVQIVQVDPGRTGLLAVTSLLADGNRTRINISRDAGESWDLETQTVGFKVEKMAWIGRDGVPVLLLASDKGLYELPLTPGATPVQVLVDTTDQDMALYAVVAAVDARGGTRVAVAAQSNGGVFLSSLGGGTPFRAMGLKGEDIRVLAVHYDGPRTFLWAGVTAQSPQDAGKGCMSYELHGEQDAPEGWQPWSTGWDGGSCYGIAFQGTRVLAGSFRSGVLRLDATKRENSWETPTVNCGLPQRDRTRFEPINALAVGLNEQLILAGGAKGVFSSGDNGVSYQPASRKEFAEKVTVPETWLFCSGEHEVTIIGEDEAE